MAVAFVIVLLFAAPLACGIFSMWLRRADPVFTESSLTLEPERAPTASVAQALSDGLLVLSRGRWGVLPSRLRSFELSVQCKNGSSWTIAEAVAQKVQALDPALVVKRSEAVTLKESGKPEKVKGSSGLAVIHNGKVLDSVSQIHVSNHSLISLRAARVVPGIIKRFPGTVRCRMVLHF